MAISTIRKAEPEDYERLHRAALRFSKRHKLGWTDDDEPGVVAWLDAMNRWDYGRLVDLWTQCKARALRESPNINLTIGCGYVGIYNK